MSLRYTRSVERRIPRFSDSAKPETPVATSSVSLELWKAVFTGASAALVHHALTSAGSSRRSIRAKDNILQLEELSRLVERGRTFVLEAIESAAPRVLLCLNSIARGENIELTNDLSISPAYFLPSVFGSFALIVAVAFPIGHGIRGVLANSLFWLTSPLLFACLLPSSQGGDETNNDHRENPTIRSLAEAKGKNATEKEGSPRYLELMVHNVSHTDVVFGFERDMELEWESNSDRSEEDYALCRPRFSCFDVYCRKAKSACDGVADNLKVLTGPLYRRALEEPRLPIQDEPEVERHPTAIGFDLPTHVQVKDWRELRVRGRDQAHIPELNSGVSSGGSLIQVFFPLLAALLPRWQQRIADKQYSRKKPIHRVLVLVTGVGTPRNWTHSEGGNSTAVAADLMKLFLKRIDPTLHVIHIHSKTNIFRYDENIMFVERELVPVVEAFRDAHGRGLPYPDQGDIGRVLNSSWTAPDRHNRKHLFKSDWLSTLALTLSFADGSSARTHAIQASLRPFRPTYFHFWQLKTFWHESKVVDDDIEVHTFESMDTVPPMDVAQYHDPWIAAVVAEMKSFLNDLVESDPDRFWLRKTGKPVLSVLLVHTAEMDKPVLYRGTNMEVSMPTGSLCAERNAIGSALSEHPSLKREDVKLVAVLAVPMYERSIALTQSSSGGGMRRVPSTSTLTSIDLVGRKVSIGSEMDDELALRTDSRKPSITSVEEAMTGNETGWIPVAGQEPLKDTEIGDSEPVRHIPLFSSSSSKPRRAVIVHSEKDINPLKPCGACNEWLKKIAESNPYFRIITFTDADCNGIYVERCA